MLVMGHKDITTKQSILEFALCRITAEGKCMWVRKHRSFYAMRENEGYQVARVDIRARLWWEACRPEYA